MRPRQYRNLAGEFNDARRKGPDAIERLNEQMQEAMTSRALDPKGLSLRDLAEYTVPDGREWVRMMDPRNGGQMLTEGGGAAVDTAAFSNIIGQLVINKVLEGYEAPEFQFTAGVEHVSTKFSGERIPGIGGIGDAALVVPEGANFQTVGLNEDYIDTPTTTKHGMIVPVTKEAIFFDRTQLVLQRAGEVGHYLGLNKEKRIIDCFIDGNTKAYKYNWKGVVYDTYQATSPWVNLKTSSKLVDWTSVEQAELLLAAMTDPNTGEVITILPDTIIVPPALAHTAFQAIRATEVRKVNLNAGGTADTVAIGPNPIAAGNLLAAGAYNVIASRIYRQQAKAANSGTADTNWYVTTLKKHVAYMENWPITVVQAPQNSEAEFVQDIVVRFKASERGTPATLDPRFTVLSQA